jgi:frataxin-like iron-binding protein CyaY
MSGPPKLVDKQVIILKTATPVAAATASSSAGGTNWTVLSTANAWNSSRQVTEFLKALKNRETG